MILTLLAGGAYVSTSIMVSVGIWFEFGGGSVSWLGQPNFIFAQNSGADDGICGGI